MVACMRVFPLVVEVLIGAGADVDHHNNNECPMTPLTCACEGKVGTQLYDTELQVECLDWLLKAGANINYDGGQGLTPLIAAAWSENVEVVKYLLHMDADVHRETCVGTVLSLMQSKSEDAPPESAIHDIWAILKVEVDEPPPPPPPPPPQSEAKKKGKKKVKGKGK